MQGVLALMQSRNIPQEPIYLLDPEAPLPLHSEAEQDMKAKAKAGHCRAGEERQCGAVPG
jgi:hypothetical protein